MLLDYDSDNVEEKEALLSLCATVHARLISQDPGLAARFDQKAEEISRDMGGKSMVMTFADLVKKASDVVDNKRRPWTAGPPPMANYYCYYGNNADNVCCIS